jgi:hypothetical protein
MPKKFGRQTRRLKGGDKKKLQETRNAVNKELAELIEKQKKATERGDSTATLQAMIRDLQAKKKYLNRSETRVAEREAKKAATNPEDWFLTQRQYWLKSKYGLSLEDYNNKLKEQDHKCAICRCDETDAFKGLLFVDHCHTSGKVRGLLCHHCNTALGKFRDSKEILSSAIDYVDKYNGTAD